MKKKIENCSVEDVCKVSLLTEMFNYLKDNLRIVVNNNADREDDYDGGKYVSIRTNVELFLTNPASKEEIKISSESVSESFYMKDG